MLLNLNILKYLINFGKEPFIESNITDLIYKLIIKYSLSYFLSTFILNKSQKILQTILINSLFPL